MAHKFLFKPEVERTPKKIVKFYRKIENNPTDFGKINKSYRQVGLKRFPFVIVFEKKSPGQKITELNTILSFKR